MGSNPKLAPCMTENDFYLILKLPFGLEKPSNAFQNDHKPQIWTQTNNGFTERVPNAFQKRV